MDGGSSSFDAPDYLGLNLEDAKVIIFGSNLNIGIITLVGDTTGDECGYFETKARAK